MDAMEEFMEAWSARIALEAERLNREIVACRTVRAAHAWKTFESRAEIERAYLTVLVAGEGQQPVKAVTNVQPMSARTQ